MDKKIWDNSLLKAVVLFIGMPVLFYAAGDVPRRTLLKEAFSLLTLVAFSLMIAQFFFTRCSRGIVHDYSVSGIVKVHKLLGYCFLTILLVHPLLIVVPRCFEAGIDCRDAFFTIITTTNSIGVVTGICAWVLMLVLGLTSFFRKQLFKNYKTWRVFHGILSVFFMVCAVWHAIDLGRHTTPVFSAYLVAGAVGGIYLLLKTNIPSRKKQGYRRLHYEPTAR